MGTNMEEYEKMLQDVSDMGMDEDFFLKKLKRQIDRRIAGIAVRIVMIFVLAALLVVPLAELIARSSYHTAVRLEKQEQMPEENGNGLARYMRAYYGTFVPYREIYDAKVERTGFAQYQISLWTLDTKQKIEIMAGGEADASLKHFFRHNQAGYEMNGIFWLLNRFEEDTAESMQAVEKEMEKLPDSALICCSLRLAEPMPIHELAQRADISLMWANVALPEAQADEAYRSETPEQDLLAGLPFDYSYLMEANKPGTDAASIRQKFVENLDLLLSEKELLEGMGIRIRSGISFLGSSQLQALRDRAAQEEILMTDSICVRAQKAELLSFLKEREYSGVYVDNVRMSIWS